MELDVLFYIAIGVFYLISQVLRGKKKSQETRSRAKTPSPPKGRPPSPRAEPAGSGRSEELDDALREIRSALGWDMPEPKPAPAPVPEPRVIPPSKVETAPKRQIPPARSEEFRSRSAAPPFKSALVPPKRPELVESAIAESTILPASGRPRFDLNSATVRDVQGRRERADELRDRLRNPESAREAFLLSEIFGRRRGGR